MNEKNLAKVAISKESNEDLVLMLEKVNEDFQFGKVTKTKLLSWIVREFYKKHFKKSLSKIQKENTDTIMQLEVLLKKAKKAKKEGNREPMSLKSLMGLSEK